MLHPNSALRRPSLLPLVLVASLGAAACGGSGGDAGSAGQPAVGDTGQSWSTLITGDWTMPPATEGYVCARQTIDEDLYVSGLQAINPPGTHHTLLTFGPPDGPDGIKDCNAAENRTVSVFGSGVGTDPLLLPEGVVMKIPAGSQLLLNLHLFNVTENAISGTSGTEILTVPEADVQHVAQSLLAGTVTLDIPPGETTVHTGHCTMTEDVTVFAVAPHMHQLGIHERVFAETAAQGDVKLFDAPYSFDEQSFDLIDPLQMASGDRLRIECTHRNTTTAEVKFGDSSKAEMCFAGVYRYPADDSFFICDDDFSAPLPITN